MSPVCADVRAVIVESDRHLHGRRRSRFFGWSRRRMKGRAWGHTTESQISVNRNIVAYSVFTSGARSKYVDWTLGQGQQPTYWLVRPDYHS